MLLRNRLFITLVAMSTIPLLVLQFGVVEKEEKEIYARTNQDLQSGLVRMSQELHALMKEQKAIAKGLSQTPIVQQFAQVASRRGEPHYIETRQKLAKFLLAYHREIPNIQAIRFIDPSGKTLVKVKENNIIRQKYYDTNYKRQYVADQSPKRFFKQALNSMHDVEVSDFELGRVNAEAEFCPAMMRYSVLMRDPDGNLEGMLVVNMWGNRIDAAIKSTLSGFRGNTYIIELSNSKERDGIYLYHPDNDKRFADQLGTSYRLSTDVKPEEWQTIRQERHQGRQELSDGRILFFKKFYPFETRPTNWMLVIETDRNTVFAATNEVRMYIWYLLGVLLLISLLTARWVSSRIARPVQELARNITDYADGNREVRYANTRQDEVGIVGRAFNYLVQRLEKTQRQRDSAEKAVQQSERLAALGQMAAGIGHEINNPLQNILSLSSFIDNYLKDHNDEELREDISLLQQEGKRCARIVQGILSFARENKPEYKIVNLSVLSEDTISLLKFQFDKSAVQLVHDIEEDIYVRADPGQLQQVLVNLSLNSIQANSHKVKFNLYTENEVAWIEITDNGDGIGEQDLGQVFNPFFTTKPEGEGTGLGLSVSYGIIKKHNGEISLENIPEQGVKATIILPVLNDVDADIAISEDQLQDVG
jgi:two-component system NtrC family sensor kinase